MRQEKIRVTHEHVGERTCTRVFVGDKEVERVRGVRFSVGIDHMPELVLTVAAFDVDIRANEAIVIEETN